MITAARAFAPLALALALAAAFPGAAAEALLEGPEVEAVRAMNAHYFRSWRERDHAWYRENLAEHFVCIAGDGSVLGKADFLAYPDQGAGIRDAHIEDVVVRVYPGGTAVVTANTVVTRTDGSVRATRYTDVYAKIDGRWKAVSAQLTADRHYGAKTRPM